MRGIFQGNPKKVILLFVTLFFVLSNLYFLAGYKVKEANAQAVVSDPIATAVQILWKGFEIAKYSADEILNDLKATFFKNVVANLARNFAKSYTQFMVTGGKGGQPYWETNIWDSIKNKGNAAYEDWLTAAVSQGTGLDLCKIDSTLTLNIALTLPSKPDKSSTSAKSGKTTTDKNGKTVLGSEAATGCSFEDLKDKFSTDSKSWQDFVKIKVTDIGPDFGITIEQIGTDIDKNIDLKNDTTGIAKAEAGAAAGATFNINPRVLNDLKARTNKLKTMREELDADITLMIDKRGAKDPVTLSVGSFILAPEYITDIKTAWQNKINPGKGEANSVKAIYKSCYKKTIENLIVSPCSDILNELGYSVPTQDWIDKNKYGVPNKVKLFEDEVDKKLHTAYNFYNSLSNGYESLSNFVNNQIKPEMFETGSLYTYQKAKTQFEPQADIAAETQKQIEAGTAAAKTDATEKQKTDLAIGGGWKAAQETISGYIKTPPDILKAKAIEALSSADSAGTYTNSMIADSLSVLLDEMYNMYIQKLLMGLSNPKQQKSTTDGNTFNAKKQSTVTGEGVNLYYESLGQNFNYTLPDLDLLQEFQTTISAKKINPNIYNNVIDLNFAMAIDQRMTISEALKAGKLNGNATFSASETLEPNTYNLSNIRKLRKARVVPLGLELAAELIRDCNFRNDNSDSSGNNFGTFPDLTYTPPTLAGYAANDIDAYMAQRLINCRFGSDSAINIQKLSQVIDAGTLKDVVDGFSKRGENGICGDRDTTDESPFCNLVDPDWVLKIPATKCLQASSNSAYGEVLQDSDTGSRYARCADFASCLSNDTRSNCGSTPANSQYQYGVCVKEKNVWRLGGDTCPPQYDSCRAYTMADSKGQKSDVAFLKNTLDSSGCSADTVGCKGYTRIYDSPYKIYFNKNVEKCEAQAEGCHEFITDPATLDTLAKENTLPIIYDDNVLATRVYYKINPACDANPSGEGCSNFMSKCADSEVGCASFEPLSGEPAVTAVLNVDDQCPSECSGFSAFFRQPTNFDLASQIAYFVPSPVKSCKAASVGCSEFTNLEKIDTGVPVAEALEYYTSLRQCIKTGTDVKTFFTWQSIDNGPQQIIKHVLQSVAADGSPKTYDNSTDCDSNTNSYCLTFYDAANATFNRDIRKTIIVSDTACYPLRKTTSNSASCTLTNGKWDIDNNYCIYNAYVPTAAEAALAGFGEKSQSCTAAENGCYNYLGKSGHNIYTVFYDNFEPSGVDLPDEYQSTGNISKSSVSSAPAGHSLKIDAGAQAVRSVEIAKDKYYVLEISAKGSGSVNVSGFGEITLSETWFNYTLGPIQMDSALNSLIITNNTDDFIYIDNIKLVQYRANYYLIENSWKQVGCGLDDLNCEAYKGPKNQTFYIKKFSNPCGADKIGCQFLLDTRNSVNPQSQDFSGVIIPADNKAAYVVNSKFKCGVEAKGCEKFSEPVWQAGAGSVSEEVILKNDPEVYLGVRGILCSADADGCTELINEDGYSEYYKINPDNICQYGSNFDRGTENNLGWYLSGVEDTVNCSSEDVIKPATGRIGACPLDAGNCSGFKTINQNVEAINPTPAQETCLGNPKNAWISGQCMANYYGQTYYIIDNEENINRQDCAAIGTDWNKGCVAFKNTVTNEAQTIKVTKDRDCAEWVDCANSNVGFCEKMSIKYYDDLGALQTPEITVLPLTTPTLAEIELNKDNKGLKDNVRYSAAGVPLIINRTTYIKRFSNATEIWDAGDYSGYTIPDRYPLETELVKGFNDYSKETVNLPDTRFTGPVCKIFPAEDSPIPGEIIYQFGYSKITNIYSQSVTMEDIADACNYDKAEAGGVTTYFPYGYLRDALGDDAAKICTGKTALNGKLCQSKDKDKKPQDCKTSADDESADTPVDTTYTYGQCQGVENITRNYGLQGRCLEMDLLNPLYGDINPGNYACLSYFPFKYDECQAVSADKIKCGKLPYCTWLLDPDDPNQLTGKCVSDPCKFKINSFDCNDSELDGACLWDSATSKCLFKACSLSGANSKAGCESLAKYCKWYGGKCMEDICSPPYTNLDGGLNSDPEPKHTLCEGKTDCSWLMKPSGTKGRYYWYCQLECGKKYTGTDEIQKTNCNSDGFCKWESAKCQYLCAQATDEDSCKGDNTKDDKDFLKKIYGKCVWSADTNSCSTICSTLSTIGDSRTPITPTPIPPPPPLDPEPKNRVTFSLSACFTKPGICKKDGTYKCANACDGKSEEVCTAEGIGHGTPDAPACKWDTSSSSCVNICKYFDIQGDRTGCEEYKIGVATDDPAIGYDGAYACEWTGGRCIKKTVTAEILEDLTTDPITHHVDAGKNFSCANLNPFFKADGTYISNKADDCNKRWGCEISYPSCKVIDDNCSALTSATCGNNANCAMGGAGCVTKYNTKGCDTLPVPGNTPCKPGCQLLWYEYSKYHFCFPNNPTMLGVWGVKGELTCHINTATSITQKPNGAMCN